MKYKKLIVFGVLFVFLMPIILSQIIKLPYGSKTIGNEEAWVSFFGSYIGGVVSALGVIITTSKIIKANKEATEYATELQDKQIREREYTIFVLKQIEETHILVANIGRLINRDAILLKMVAEALQVEEDFKRINFPKIEEFNKDDRTMVLDRHTKFVDNYKALQREEQELRFELIEKLENIHTKAVIIPDISKELYEINQVINDNLENVKDHYAGVSYDTESAIKIFEKFKNDYKEKEKLLKLKLTEYSNEVKSLYLKTLN